MGIYEKENDQGLDLDKDKVDQFVKGLLGNDKKKKEVQGPKESIWNKLLNVKEK